MTAPTDVRATARPARVRLVPPSTGPSGNGPPPPPRPSPARVTAGQLAWVGVLPAAAGYLAAAAWLAPALGARLVSGSGTDFFASARASVRPEPTELTRYLLAVVFGGLLAIWALLAPRLVGDRAGARPAFDVLVLVNQAAALVLVVVGLVAHARAPSFGSPPTVYFRAADVAIAVAAAGVLLVGARRRARRRDRGPEGTAGTAPASRRRWAGPAAGLGVATAVTAAWLLPAIFRDDNFGQALGEVQFHLNFTMGEFQSVRAGRTPLVDFIPQYSSVLPYLVAPVLAVLGSSVTVFTTVLTGLSLVALLAVYGVFTTVTRRWTSALLLYVPFLAISLFSVRAAGDQRFYYANYYAVLPLRYLGPFVLAWLCARRLAGPEPGRSLLLFSVAGLVAVNNPEFGLPAAAAAVAALWAAHEGPALWRPAVAVLGRAASGLALAWLVVAAVSLLRTSSLPKPAYLFYWSKSFGVAGFYLLPMPHLGFHLVVFATFVAALVAAIARRAREEPDVVLTGMLAYSAVFGMGASSYYAGRSHPYVLVAVFAAWGLALALLAWDVLGRLAHRSRPDSRSVRQAALPGLAVLVGFGLMVSAVAQVPAPWEQLRRIGRSGPSRVLDRSGTVRFVDATTRDGERVLLLDPLGHEVARQAGVVDVSLYDSPLQVLAHQQMEDLLARLEEEGGRKVFAGIYVAPEVTEALEDAGFVPDRVDRTVLLVRWVR